MEFRFSLFPSSPFPLFPVIYLGVYSASMTSCRADRNLASLLLTLMFTVAFRSQPAIRFSHRTNPARCALSCRLFGRRPGSLRFL